MFPAVLPFEYVRHINPGDRYRRTRIRPNGSRVRRGASERA